MSDIFIWTHSEWMEIMAHSSDKVYDVEKSFTDLFWARYIIPLIWSSFAAAPPLPKFVV